MTFSTKSHRLPTQLQNTSYKMSNSNCYCSHCASNSSSDSYKCNTTSRCSYLSCDYSYYVHWSRSSCKISGRCGHVYEIFALLGCPKIAGPLKMWPMGCPEMSVTNYQLKLRYISEQQSSQKYKISHPWQS